MSRSRSIKVFKRFFTKHLLFTNTLVSGTLMGLGDALQQNLAKWNSTGGRHEHHYDWSRTGSKHVRQRVARAACSTLIVYPRCKKVFERECHLSLRMILHRYSFLTGRMLTVGLVCGAPLHGWYKMLDWLLPGKSRMVILKKVLVDQVIASPTLILGFFIGIIKGHMCVCVCVNFEGTTYYRINN